RPFEAIVLRGRSEPGPCREWSSHDDLSAQSLFQNSPDRRMRACIYAPRPLARELSRRCPTDVLPNQTLVQVPSNDGILAPLLPVPRGPPRRLHNNSALWEIACRAPGNVQMRGAISTVSQRANDPTLAH